jgi:hypothetical protein
MHLILPPPAPDMTMTFHFTPLAFSLGIPNESTIRHFPRHPDRHPPPMTPPTPHPRPHPTHPTPHNSPPRVERALPNLISRTPHPSTALPPRHSPALSPTHLGPQTPPTPTLHMKSDGNGLAERMAGAKSRDSSAARRKVGGHGGGRSGLGSMHYPYYRRA